MTDAAPPVTAPPSATSARRTKKPQKVTSRKAKVQKTKPQKATTPKAKRQKRKPKNQKPTSRQTKAPSVALAEGSLASRLRARIAEEGLSLAAAGRAIGVNAVGLKRMLQGSAKPNKRTAKRYDRWLASDGTTASPARSTPARGRPQRQTARPQTDLLQMRLVDLLDAAAAAKNPPVVKVTKAERAYLADKLARRVHDAPSAARRLVGTVLSTLA